jgi:hypothetical protein
MLNGDEPMSRGATWTSTRLAWALSAAAAVALAISACGSNTGGHAVAGTGGNGTGTAGFGTGTAGQTGTGGVTTTGTGGNATTGTAGNTGTAGMPAGGTVAQCTKYCTTIMANCTGVNQQYADMANCMKVCSYIPGGTPTDTNVHSVGCLTNVAATATADAMQYKSECFQAGPLTYGTCGNDCDTFCAVAEAACGTPPYTSLTSCSDLCGQMSRQVTFGMPGTYGVNYTPGNAADNTKDTLECRAYHLFIKGLPNAAGLAAECANAANMSAACGPGVAPIDTDAGTTPTDGPVVTFDAGGSAKSINATNCNDTLFPPAKRKMLLRDEGDPHMVMIDLSKPTILQWKSVAEGPWARGGQLIGNNQILGGTSTGYQVWDYTTGMMVKQITGFGNTQSAYRMVTGETMLTTSGTVLKFLDKTDKMAHQISYPGHGYVRVARPTRKGTFLIPNDQTVFEGDANGKELWTLTAGASGWGHIWEPLMLGPPPAGGMWKDGDTILCTAFGSSCDVIDQTTHKVTFRFGTKQMPEAAMVAPNFFSEFEILPDGHIFTANWQGHGPGNGGHGLQVLEFDQTGKLVWYWKQDPTIFSSIQGVQMMDCKDPKYLHVEETSPDSTWQPVMPTP